MQAKGLRKRPFEFFAAFLVMVLGIYALANPDWPPHMIEGWEVWVLNMEAFYFVFSGAVVMASFFTRPKWPIASIVAQMFGWLFIGFAGVMALVIRVVIESSPILPNRDNPYLSIATFAVWLTLIAASFVRYFDIRTWYRSVGRK